MKFPRFFLILCGAVWLLTACNTVEGMGRDIRGAGEAITGSAQKTKEKMR